ncbi:MAG: hypothetical protein KDJ25_09935 [Rhodoblastus sp.]|nr:hypothetical protein [Rhodoblastus sp.]
MSVKSKEDNRSASVVMTPGGLFSDSTFSVAEPDHSGKPKIFATASGVFSVKARVAALVNAQGKEVGYLYDYDEKNPQSGDGQINETGSSITWARNP